MNPLEVANRIEHLCQTNGVTISKMLSACNLSKSVVDNLKKGSMPSADKISAIANYFNVSTDYLLGNEQKEKPSGKAEGQEITFDDFTYALHNETKELTEENKEKLLEMARFFKEQQNKKKKE